MKIITLTNTKDMRRQLSGSEYHAVLACMGRILPVDYGRRVYLDTQTGIAQAESMAQFKKRHKARKFQTFTPAEHWTGDLT